MFRLNFLILLALITFTCKNTAKGQESPESIISNFFQKYETNIESSLSYLFSTSKYIKDDKQAINNAHTSLINLTKQLGPYHGYEFITERKLSNSLVLRSYLIKYDRQPLRFTFIFYKPENTWMAFNFFFDDKLDDELKESAKVYLNNEVYNEKK